jgi:hypothetical protein
MSVDLRSGQIQGFFDGPSTTSTMPVLVDSSGEPPRDLVSVCRTPAG